MPKQQHTSEGLIEHARELLKRRGESLTMIEFCRTVGVSQAVIALRFGSWPNLRELAGYSARSPCRRKYTQDEIIERLRRVAAREGVQITRDEFTKLTGICQWTITRYFGSWAKLRDCADLPTIRRGRNLQYTDTMLIQEVHQVAQELGRVPRAMEFYRRSRISMSTYQQRYGSWRIVAALYENYLSRLRQGRTGVSGEV
jgi:hypothetical protein